LGDRVKIVLAQPARLGGNARLSLAAGKLQLQQSDDAHVDSVADGLRQPLGECTWPIVRDLVDEVFTVFERDILRATKLVWERLKVLIEPTAAVGVAVALFSGEFAAKYPAEDFANVGCILSGGNVDILKIAEMMQIYAG